MGVFQRFLPPRPHAGYATGDYLLPMGGWSFANRTLATAAQVHAFPFCFERRAIIDLLRIYLVTAQTGGEMMAGIYTNRFGYPDALLLDLGTKSLASGGGANVDWTISGLGAFDWLWALLWNKNVATGATVRGPSVAVGGHMIAAATTLSAVPLHTPYLSKADTYPASMPATAPTGLVTGLTTNTPVPMLRIG